MSFRDKLNAVALAPLAERQVDVVTKDASQGLVASDAYKLLKGQMHLKLLDKFDLAVLETLPPALLRQEIASMVERLLQDEGVPVRVIGRNAAIDDFECRPGAKRAELLFP